MPTPASDLLKRFDNFVRTASVTRERVEKLSRAGRLSRRDAETVYAGLYLSVFARFEALIEELFFGLLVGRIDRQSCRATPRIAIANRKIAKEVVQRERKYIDWLPYGRTEELAKTFLRAGFPFTRLDNGDKSQLGNLLIIRNALAHQSGHAKRTFVKQVLGTIPLPPRERTVRGFLRSQYRVSPAQTRFELYLQQLRSFVIKLTR